MKKKHKITQAYKVSELSKRLSIIYAENKEKSVTFADDVKSGLSSFPKRIAPKYFYDNRGSALFEKICGVPEYYVTRTEASILQENSRDIAASNSDKHVIVELGSGSSVKTGYLLSAFLNNSGAVNYIPVDVSDILIKSSERLINEFTGLNITGIIGEYEESLGIVSDIVELPKVILFLGSSIGNFSQGEASVFLAGLKNHMKPEDSLIIGFDKVKNIKILNAAYNDEQGVTAEFNMNLLNRINSELGGNFDLAGFRHNAFYNPGESRIEMHLVSLKKQKVYIDKIGLTGEFGENETIHTENSYKFTDKMINNLADTSGLIPVKSWNDPDKYFSLCQFVKK